jgi:hypothetical protein
MAGLARKYVASALADWQHVLDCEDEVSRIEAVTPEVENTVNRALYEVYQRWAADAEQVLARTRQLAGHAHLAIDLQALEHAYARAQARLKLTPPMMEQAMQKIREGRAVPMQELRDELCARVRA